VTGLRVTANRDPAIELLTIENALQQIKDARSGSQHFSKSYLKRTELLEYWRYTRTFIPDFWNGISGPKWASQREIVTKQINELEKEAEPLPNLLLEAVTHGLLGEDDRAAIRDRLLLLDEILKEFHYVTGTDSVALVW
jgi:hypothetical protein